MHSTTSSDPITRFLDWQAAARAASDPQWNLVALTTNGPDAYPDQRMMTLWEIRPDGFVVSVNEKKAKGRQLLDSPKVGMLAFWSTLHRQVRVQGIAFRLPAAESDVFFASRPEQSRAMDWVGLEGGGQVISDLEPVRARVAKIREHYGTPVPRAPWSNLWIVSPVTVEFWQQGEDRLHDRVRHRREKKEWVVERLLP